MQREIKFRAWYKEVEQMLTVRDINFCGEELDTYEMDGDWLSFDDVELLQFTGLLDKNGKEIYEGDILLWGDDNRQNRVVFSQGGFQMQRYGGLAPLRHFNLINSETMDTEVIGNIYENSELLKEA